MQGENIYSIVTRLERKLCCLEKAFSKLLLLKVNGIDNKLQSILDLVDSDTIEFEYLIDGKVTAHSTSGGTSGVNIEVVDNYADIDLNDFTKRFIEVITDEINNNDNTLYMCDGIGFRWIVTLTPGL